MFTIEIDINETNKELNKIISDLEELPILVAKEWPRRSWRKAENKIRSSAIENLKLAYTQSISNRTVSSKRKEKEQGVKLIRTKSGQEFPVIESEVPWYRTGFMERTLTEKLQSVPNYELLGGEENIEFGINIDVDEFYEDYPLDVNVELLKRSGGSVGLVILQDQQANEILDLIIKDNINSFDEYFGSEK